MKEWLSEMSASTTANKLSSFRLHSSSLLFLQRLARLFRQTSSLKILLLVALLLCASSCVPEDERYKEIRPGIKATSSGVEVTNRDSFNYPKVTVYLNGNFETFVGDIPPGKTVSIPFDKFTDGGTRFDISARKLRYIRVKAMFGKNASDINFEVH